MDELGSTQDEKGRIPVVMTGNPSEADLTAIKDADWTALADVAGLEHAEGDNAIKQIAEGKPIGRELWKYLALTALVILIAEVALTRWIATQRQVTADPVSDFEFRSKTGDSAHLERFASSTGRQAAASRAREAVV
jgi:hypothetical protein